MEATQEKKAAGAAAPNLVPIFVMGKRYLVPDSMTIQKAMEHAGYQLVRGCGCRGGICGACATVYRLPGSHKILVGLACQTVVQPNMYIAQVPFFPGNKATYDVRKEKPDGGTVARLYPEIFRCVACNACTKACPMDIKVMDYVNAAMRGDVAEAARTSFDCVMCGLCASRCMAEIVQYNVAILCRRLYARHLAPPAAHLKNRVAEIASGKYEADFEALMKTPAADLKKLYTKREEEPQEAAEGWMPKDPAHL
ncbi:MAG: 4Fe-4S dicluster domain-containing protein [Planctomycetes bacterium]|jgi:Fe-S oxidoreductase|nr:4Fe-4S dicluster domain-containing protein [Planctomycetota bacterium]